MTSITIRPVDSRDIEDLTGVVAETGLFPPEMLADLIDPHLTGQEDCLWLLAITEGKIAGFCYGRAEHLTDGCWNMLALGVASADRRHGIARRLATALETMLAASGVRLLIVNTSGSADFAAARRFYEAAGYAREASIRDYWAEGDDKITFRKSLG